MFDWIIGPLAVLGALAVLAWLGPLAVRRLLHDLRSGPGGGSVCNPLQEIVQPQIRHVEQVREHRLEDDDQGGPPEPEPPRE
jgi:hypothetical protein